MEPPSSVFTNVGALSELFAYFEPRDVLGLRRVCRVWRDVADREYVWYTLAKRLKVRCS